MRLSCERNCNGFSVKARTWAPFQSAHSTAGHKIPEPWVRCQVCMCLERSITRIAALPWSAVSMFPPPKGWARRANGDRECPMEQPPSTEEMRFTGELWASYWKNIAMGLFFTSPNEEGLAWGHLGPGPKLFCGFTQVRFEKLLLN